MRPPSSDQRDNRVLDHHQVVESLEAFERGLIEAAAKSTAFESARHSLSAAYEFVQSFAFLRDRNLGAPLFALHLALQDLQKGKVAALLRPPAKRSKSPPTSTLQMRGIAIVCDDLLRDLGAEPGESLKFIAKHMRKNGFDFGGSKKSDARIVAYWRSEISRDESNATALFVTAARAEVKGRLPETATLAEAQAFVAIAIENTMRGLGRFGSEIPPIETRD